MKTVNQNKNQKRKAQTILELTAVLFVVTAFFAASFIFFTYFDVSQKQVMLVRTQAMIELGNFSDFGRGPHGQDKIEDGQSALVFSLGERTQGTRVNLDEAEPFKEAVEGEMQFVGSMPRTEYEFWQRYRFPTGRVEIELPLRGLAGSQRSILFQTAAISSNRSLKLNEDPSGLRINRDDRAGGTGMYSGATHFSKWGEISELELIVGRGLIDNTALIEAALNEIVEEDPSILDEANEFRGRLSALDGLTAGGIEALIIGALTLVTNNLLPLLSNASAGAGAAANQGPAGALMQAVSGKSFIPNALFHNISAGLGTFAGAVGIVDGVARLGGNDIKGLRIVGQVAGAAGAITGAVSSFQKFDGLTYNNELVLGQAGLASDVFGGLGQLTSGAGTFAGFADENVGRGFGLASQVFTFGGSVASFSENARGLTGKWRTFETDEAGNKVLTGWVDGAGWAATSAVGQMTSGAGGLITVAAPNSDVGKYMSFGGAAASAVGQGGMFSHGVKTGDISFGKPFEAMVHTGTFVGTVSGLGTSAAGMAGDQDLAKAFAYGSLAGGALATAGAVGIIAEEGSAAIKEWQKERAARREAEKNGQATADAEGTGAKGKITEEPAGKKEDTRTAFQKLNDAKAAIDKGIEYGNIALGTAHGVKGAVDAYNQAKAQAQQEIAAAEADYARAVAAANQAATGQGASGQASAAAGTLGSGTASRSGAYNRASDLEVSSAQSAISGFASLSAQANQVISDPELEARFQAYQDVFRVQQAHVQGMLARGSQPDQAIVRQMLDNYAKMQRIIEASRGSPAPQNSGAVLAAANPGASLNRYVTERLSPVTIATMEKSHRYVVNAVASQIRQSGFEGFRESAAENYGKAGNIEELRNSFRKINRQKLRRIMSHSDYRKFVAKLPMIDEALAYVDEHLQANRLPNLQVLRVAQQEAEAAQAILDPYLRKAPVGTRERDLQEEKLYEANVALIKKAQEYYENLAEEDAEIMGWVEAAEQKVNGRTILAKNYWDARSKREFGKSVAERIADHREKYYTEDSETSRRLRVAEYAWGRMQFVTARQAFENLVQSVEEYSRRYNELKKGYEVLVAAKEGLNNGK